MLKKIFLVLRTVRHIRLVQFYSQILWRLCRGRRLRGIESDVTLPQACRLQLQSAVVAPVPEAPYRGVKEGLFCFIHQEAQLGFPPEWRPKDQVKLFEYNLQYLDALYFLNYEDSRALKDSWIGSNAADVKSVAWDPYPIALRLMNCCLNFYGRHRSALVNDGDFADRLNRSLQLQASALLRQLEYHLLGNHLFEDAAALVIYGLTFEGELGERCYDQGLKLLLTELPEQFPADGLHFEKSPMYHCRMLWLLLTLYNTGDSELRTLIAPYAKRGLRALKMVCHPDGDIALFNDSAFGIYLSPHDLLGYGESLGFETLASDGFSVEPLKGVGFVSSLTNKGDYLLYKTGAVGPGYIPGHAHGDLLSYELSLNGERVVVDSGVYDYVASDMRRYCRSSAAHNTLVIDAYDQCEFWGAFRMARRVVSSDEEMAISDTGWRMVSRVGNYACKARHRRAISWSSSGELVVKDSVEGAFSEALSFVHLHPDCRLLEEENGRLVFAKAGRRFALRYWGCDVELRESWYCPGFSVRQKNICIVFSVDKGAELHYELKGL